jgi:DNA-directed RNA polymerase specialized sigma24 family protein
LEAVLIRADSESITAERDLVARARTGDMNAFETLYRANINRIYALAYRLAGDATLAAEQDPTLRLDLDQAVAKLPPGARCIFVLHDVEGHDHEEIARMTGVRPGTSKAQLHRARRLLREVLNR